MAKFEYRKGVDTGSLLAWERAVKAKSFWVFGVTQRTHAPGYSFR